MNAYRADHSSVLRRQRLHTVAVTRATVSADGETITVHIPLTFRKRGGRKLVVTPDGAAWAPRPRVDNAMVKALARAFRWRRMLDTGVHATLEDWLGEARTILMSRFVVLQFELSNSIPTADCIGRAPLALGTLRHPVRVHGRLRADVVQFFAEPRIVSEVWPAKTPPFATPARWLPIRMPAGLRRRMRVPRPFFRAGS